MYETFSRWGYIEGGSYINQMYQGPMHSNFQGEVCRNMRGSNWISRIPKG